MVHINISKTKCWLLMLACMALCTSTAMAYDFEVNGIYYNKNGSAEATVVSGNGYSGDIVIPETVTYGNDTYSVTAIGGGAFANTGLTSIELPSSIETIQAGAFENCTALENITVYCSPDVPSPLENLHHPFRGCENIKRVEFHCKSIKPLLYRILSYGYFRLNECIIGNEVDTIDTYGLSTLIINNLYIQNRLQSINDWPIQVENLYITDLLTHINSGWNPGFDYWYYNLDLDSFWGYNYTHRSGQYTYVNGSLLSDLIIPNIDSIPPQFFLGNKGLTRVNTGNYVKVIGADAFSGCSNLTDVVIGNSVTCLKGNAFDGCSNLKNVTIGENVESIGSDLLWIDESGHYKEVIHPSAFGYNAIQSITWNAINCKGLGTESYIFYGSFGLNQEIVFGDKVKFIPSYFVGYSYMTSLNIPASVMYIGESAFSDCYSLDSLYWNAKNCNYVTDDLELLQEGSPFYSSPLKHLYIGSEVESIGGSMFNGYSYFGEDDDSDEHSTVTCYATVPPIITAICFSDFIYENAVLEVPEGSLDFYRNAEGWRNFQHIVPIGVSVNTGDVNGDGEISIADVSALIDMLLTGDTSGNEGADVDGDGEVSIADVTVLIDYLLTGSWQQ